MGKQPGKLRSRAAEAIHRRIRGLVKTLLTREGDESLSGLPEAIELNLRIPMHLKRDHHADSIQFSHALLAQVESLRIQGETEALGHRFGHAPCYWCDAPVCEHSMPGDQRSVLVGWSATGIPLWRDIASLLIETGDEQIDLLYGEDPGPVICWRGEGELLGEILPEYLSDSLFARPVGALLAGGFPLPGHSHDNLSVTALVVESRAGRIVPRYSLNLLSTTPAPHHLATLLGENNRSILSGWIGSLKSALHRFQQELVVEATRGQRDSLKSCRERVVDLLIDSRSHLETLRRRSQRRTMHAQERSENPNRPTSAAIPDLLACSEADLFQDRKESTIVLRGPQGRIHIFTATGRHITSAIYSSESIQTRIARSRWILLGDVKARAFIERVNRSIPESEPGRPASDAS